MTTTSYALKGWERFYDAVPHYKIVCENPAILRFPIGDASTVLKGIKVHGKDYYPQIGHILPQHIDEFTLLSKKWLENGFTLRLGTEVGEKYWMAGSAVEYYRYGHRPVMKATLPTMKALWLEISDIEKAAKFLETNRDIPAVVICGASDYSDNPQLRVLVDKANEYFLHYFLYGEVYAVRNRDEDYKRMLLRDV